MRPRTITVDVTRGGGYALADYRRQCDEHTMLRWMERAGSGIYHITAGEAPATWWCAAGDASDVPVGIVKAVSPDGRHVEVLIGGATHFKMGATDERRN